MYLCNRQPKPFTIMKKITIIMFLLLCVASINAQAPFTTYTPVYPGAERRQQSQPQEQLQTITAYYINQRGAFEKIRIKVNVVQPQYGKEAVYVRAYYMKAHDMWNSMNTRATEITSYSNDPEVIKENFSWKCYILNIGNVYF